MPTCTHLDQIQIMQLPESVEGCEQCLVAGDRWRSFPRLRPSGRHKRRLGASAISV